MRPGSDKEARMASKALLEITLKHVKDTKGTRVFGNSDEGAAISSVYIAKEAAKDLPNEITITISAA
jgi:hypothetical protein